MQSSPPVSQDEVHLCSPSRLWSGLATLQVYGGPTRLEASEDAVVGIHGEPSLGDARGPGPSEDDIFYRGAFNPVKRAANPEPKRSKRKPAIRKPAIKPVHQAVIKSVSAGVLEGGLSAISGWLG